MQWIAGDPVGAYREKLPGFQTTAAERKESASRERILRDHHDARTRVIVSAVEQQQLQSRMMVETAYAAKPLQNLSLAPRFWEPSKFDGSDVDLHQFEVEFADQRILDL